MPRNPSRWHIGLDEPFTITSCSDCSMPGDKHLSHFAGGCMGGGSFGPDGKPILTPCACKAGPRNPFPTPRPRRPRGGAA